MSTERKNLISVIVPVYNNENYIEECLDSIINQTYKNIEIIIINDGSTDTSMNKCLNFCKMDNRLKVFSKNNEGVSIARNTALRYANGEYITFIDADDKYFPDTLERMLNAIKENNSDIAICAYTVEESSKRNKDSIYKNISNHIEYIQELLLNQNVKGFVWNKLYKRKFFENINFPSDLSVCEDLYVNCLIAEKYKPKVVIFDEQLYFYRNNEKSVTRSILKLFSDQGFIYDKAFTRIKEIFTKENTKINNYIDQAFFNIVIDTSFILFQNKLNSKYYTSVLKNILKKYNIGLKSNRKKFIKYLLFNISPKILYFLWNITRS